MISKAIVFFFLFFSIFGFKIGVLDLSLAIPAALLPFMVTRNAKIPLPFMLIFYALIMLMAYQVTVQIATQNIDIESSGRIMRAAISSIIIGVFLSGMHKDNAIEILKMLTLAIALHGIFIIISALHQPTNELLSILGGNDRVRPLRSSGVLAGYDMAGLISIFGILLLTAPINILKNEIYRFSTMAILILAALFTSRVSMAICLIIFSFFLAKFISKSKSHLAIKIVLIALSLLVVFQSFKWLAVIIEITFSLGIIDVSRETVDLVTSRFAAHTGDDLLWGNMFFLPNDPINIIFGVGIEPGNSDVGYIREIFRYGVVGLILAIAIHLIFIGLCYKNNIGISRLNFFAYAPIVLMLLLTLKNNYILVRTAFPVFIIVTYCYGVIYGKRREFKL